MDKSVDKFRYLEKVIDFENGIDLGPLAEKEVLVYAPEKTGTVTLFHTLGNYLTENGPWKDYKEKLLHNHRNDFLINSIKITSLEITKGFLRSRKIIKDLAEYKRLTNRSLLIVSSFREPLDRAISNVFQGLDKRVFIDHVLKPEEVDFNEVKEQLLDFLKKRNFYHSLEDIEPDFFVKEQFDKEKKCCFVDRGHYRILVVCLEHSDRWKRIFETELGYNGIDIVYGNQTSKKQIARMYSDFKKNLSLPDSIIKDAYFNGPAVNYLKWFYTDDEIEAFYKRSLEQYGETGKGIPVQPSDRTTGSAPVFSSDIRGRTGARIELIECSAKSSRRFTVQAILTNIGDTVWLSGIPRKGIVALVLRAKSKNQNFITSNWYLLQDQVNPGETIDVEANFTIPDGTEDLPWTLDLVAKDVGWFSSSGTEAVPVDIRLANIKDEQRRSSINDLNYLEKIIDFENGVDKGPISEKEVLIYAPGKTGTISLFNSVGEYLSLKTNTKAPFQKLLLHSHNNKTVLDNVKIIDPEVDREFLQSRFVVRDLVEYKRLTKRSLLIISSFREPLDCKISGVFEQINRQVFVEKNIALEFFNHEKCLEMVWNAIRYFRHPLEELEPDFFERERFDKEKKCLLVDRGHYKILVVCLEHSDRWQTIFEKEQGFKGIEMSRHNQTSDKMAAEMYSDFKSNLSLPKSVIKNIYRKEPFVKYLKWFYTDDEIEAFYRRSLDRYGERKNKKNGKSKIRSKDQKLRLSSDMKGKTLAKIELIECKAGTSTGCYSITTKLTNIGKTVWLSGVPRQGTTVLALRAKTKNNNFITSTWYLLQDQIEPGESIIVEADFTIPEGTEDLSWVLDLVANELFWFSDRGTKTVPVDIGSENKSGGNTDCVLHDLSYLEKIIDFEGGVDKGPISQKEILVYAPGKTGTVSLFHSVREYLEKKTNPESPVQELLLHSHNNNTLLQNIKNIDPEIDGKFLQSRTIIKDLVEYRHRMDRSTIIISSFREPLGRAISAVFQRVDRIIYIDRDLAPDALGHEECTELLHRFLNELNFTHPLEELEPDFFERERFDKEKKCLLVDRGHYKILVVCLEHSDKWQTIFEKELGFKGIEMSRHNQTSDKMVSEMYSDFKSNLSLPKSVIKNIYRKEPFVKYLKWFYTDDEIENFYERSLALYGAQTKDSISPKRCPESTGSTSNSREPTFPLQRPRLYKPVELFRSLIPHSPVQTVLNFAVSFLQQRPRLLELAKFTCSLMPTLERRIWAAVYNLPSQQEQFFTTSVKKGFFHPETKRFPESTERVLTRIQSLRTSKAERITDSNDNRPRLAYVSPVPPVKSGIASYSSELLPQLAEYYNITVIVAQDKTSDVYLPVRSIMWFKKHYRSFDRVMYHIGNSAYHSHMVDLLDHCPGVVVLHDVYLGHFFHEMNTYGHRTGIFDRHLYLSHGYKALKYQQFHGRESILWRFPLSIETINASYGTIVHSQFAHDLLKPMCPDKKIELIGVVPLANRIPEKGDREAARDRLGLPHDLVIICCFGELGPTKMNDRLIEAWRSLEKRQIEGARLIFVGRMDGSFFNAELHPIVGKLNIGSNVRFTGEVEAEKYRDYLIAADAAVQLRSKTRGETSRSALECMAYGLPIIINDHGSNREIPDHCVVKIEESFSNEMLCEKLSKLIENIESHRDIGRQARRFIADKRSPQMIAKKYRDQLESKFSNGGPSEYHMLSSIADLYDSSDVSKEEIVRRADEIARNASDGRRYLYIDISEIVKKDRKTGVQRVIKNILYSGVDIIDERNCRIEAVYEYERKHYLARNYLFSSFGADSLMCPDLPVSFGKNDCFIGIDFTISQYPYLGDMLSSMRQAGTVTNIVVYDLLPIFHPSFFQEPTIEMFSRWFDAAITNADGLICISRSVADELLDWIESNPPHRSDPLKIGYFHLGTELNPEKAFFRNNHSDPLQAAPVVERPTVLMVGTIEPRKGYAQTVDAFDILWREEVDINLVIVGQEGWLVEDLVKRLRSHPEQGNRLHWLDNAGDDILENLYKDATLLLVASEGEGFGLPIVEAAGHQTPVLARDLPVFREVAGDGALYFSGNRPESISEKIKEWIDLHERGLAPDPGQIPILSWKQSAEQLFDVIVNNNWYAEWDGAAARLRL